MATYRKKPEVIEARQLLPGNTLELMDWCGGTYWSNPPMRQVTGIQFPLAGSNSNVEVAYGDWVIKNEWGHFSSLTDDYFQKKYEPIEDRHQERLATLTVGPPPKVIDIKELEAELANLMGENWRNQNINYGG